MASSQPTNREKGRQLHRRQTRWQIILPFCLLIIVIFAMPIITALLPTASHISIVSDWMFTLLVLCPMVLCFFVPLVITVAMAYGVGRLHDGVQPPLERLEDMTASMNERVGTLTDTANERVVGWTARLEPFLYLLRIFDGKADEQQASSDTSSPPNEKTQSDQ